jgi:hypothetical protein
LRLGSRTLLGIRRWRWTLRRRWTLLIGWRRRRKRRWAGRRVGRCVGSTLIWRGLVRWGELAPPAGRSRRGRRRWGRGLIGILSQTWQRANHGQGNNAGGNARESRFYLHSDNRASQVASYCTLVATPKWLQNRHCRRTVLAEENHAGAFQPPNNTSIVIPELILKLRRGRTMGPGE